MPVKSGLDYLPELKAQHPDVAVVMLTGDADLENAVRTMRDGAFDYIAKPVGLADLIIRVEYALSRRALILDNKAYQQRQKNLVDRLNASVEQRKSELSALSELFKSDMSEGLAAQEAYTQLRDSVETFNLELQGFADALGLDSDKSSPREYELKHVHLESDQPDE